MHSPLFDSRIDDMADEEKPGKKIETAETLLIMSLGILADILEAITLGTLGIIINFIVAGLIALWIYMRKLKYTRFLIGAGLDMIPFVNLLPLKSVGLWFTIKAANNPKVAAVASAAQGKIPKSVS